MCENNILHDAYYLINKYNQDCKDVTNLKIQKLMYFFEAYYMNVYDVDKLYDCNFHAWAFGPVASPLYEEFRKFRNNPIILTEENKQDAEEISEEKKELLDYLYEVFKDVPTMDLVEYTHMSGSPWEEVWKRNGMKVPYGADTSIDKIKTKNWFKSVFNYRQY